jgi:hypothetical protein
LRAFDVAAISFVKEESRTRSGRGQLVAALKTGTALDFEIDLSLHLS